MTRWIADTSPLIFLAKLNRLDLLERGADEILIPPAVLREIRQYPDEATARIEEALRTWLKVRPVDHPRVVEILMADLDAGEAEVVALARELEVNRVVLDDLDARRFARRVGLAPVGTLGLLLAARSRGELPSVREEVERLRREGFRVSDALLKAVLQEAGEL